MKGFIAGALGAAFATLPGTASAGPDGTWTAEAGKTHVRIEPCGEALCGTVAWMRRPNHKDGRVKRDEHNPQPGLRGRPIVGIPVLSGMVATAPGAWKGQIYNPQDGRTYAAFLTMDGADALTVEGCVLGGLICRAQDWRRVE